MVNKIFGIALLFLIMGGGILIHLNCAGQFPPTYGPPDTVPPQIITTYPLPKTINFNEEKLHLEFSKYVDHRSVEQSIFFSPNLGKVKYNWGGKGVDIEYRSKLRPNTTYIMTIGTDVIDLHNNRMAKAFSLPFSTGNKIDTASITGRVFDRSPEGIMIYAFDLQYKHPDTLDPSINKPDYLTQTGKDGSFILPYLKVGMYRVMAVRDEYKNFQYDRQVDEYGLLPRDVVLTNDSSHKVNMQFRLTKEDTTRPFLAKVLSTDKNHVVIRFSKVIDTTSLKLQYIRVFDTLTQATLDLKDISVFGDSAIAAQLITADQEKDKGYRIIVTNLQDLKGNSIFLNPGGTVFTGESAPDTIKPKVKITNIIEGSKNVDAGDSFFIAFDKPIVTSMFEHGFTITDSGKTKVDGAFSWWGSTKTVFIPAHPYRYSMPYIIKINLDSVRDVPAHNHYKDSTLSIHFQTIAQSILSSVSGEVIDEAASASGNIVINLFPVNAVITKTKQQILSKPGPFSFENVPEGTYSFFVFRDTDGNGRYTFGRPYPFQPAERFSVYKDTLKLRARWPLEGVVLRLKP
ncbi:MAG: Ig-like domain-containing protein [Bacteroidota bacterium]